MVTVKRLCLPFLRCVAMIANAGNWHSSVTEDYNKLLVSSSETKEKEFSLLWQLLQLPSLEEISIELSYSNDVENWIKNSKGLRCHGYLTDINYLKIYIFLLSQILYN